MNVYFDTEFTGLVPGTTLISIGAITEYGEEFYAEFTDYNEKLVDKWIFDNVIEHLFYRDDDPQFTRGDADSWMVKGKTPYVAKVFRNWCEKLHFDHPDVIQFVSDVCQYDSVLIFDLFGGAINLPNYISPAVYDINQMIAEKTGKTMKEVFDISREDLLMGAYRDLPEGDKHNSLYDARMVKMLYDGFRSVDKEVFKAQADRLVMWNKE